MRHFTAAIFAAVTFKAAHIWLIERSLDTHPLLHSTWHWACLIPSKLYFQSSNLDWAKGAIWWGFGGRQKSQVSAPCNLDRIKISTVLSDKGTMRTNSTIRSRLPFTARNHWTNSTYSTSHLGPFTTLPTSRWFGLSSLPKSSAWFSKPWQMTRTANYPMLLSCHGSGRLLSSHTSLHIYESRPNASPNSTPWRSATGIMCVIYGSV